MFSIYTAGNFGEVYWGLWTKSSGDQDEVALKKLKNEDQLKELKDEITTLMYDLLSIYNLQSTIYYYTYYSDSCCSSLPFSPHNPPLSSLLRCSSLPLFFFLLSFSSSYLLFFLLFAYRRKLHHFNIVKFLGVYSPDDRPEENFIVVEYMALGSLLELLQNTKNFSFSDLGNM